MSMNAAWMMMSWYTGLLPCQHGKWWHWAGFAFIGFSMLDWASFTFVGFNIPVLSSSHCCGVAMLALGHPMFASTPLHAPYLHHICLTICQPLLAQRPHP